MAITRTVRHFAREAYRLALTHGKYVSTYKSTLHHYTCTVDCVAQHVHVECRTTGDVTLVPIADSWKY